MMIKNNFIALAVLTAALFAALPAEAAQLTIRNAHRFAIHVTARRTGHGADHVFHGSRRFHEEGRFLDLGRIHGGESRTFVLDSGNWEIQSAHRSDGPRAEGTEVHLHSQQHSVIQFQ